MLAFVSPVLYQDLLSWPFKGLLHFDWLNRRIAFLIWFFSYPTWTPRPVILTVYLPFINFESWPVSIQLFVFLAANTGQLDFMKAINLSWEKCTDTKHTKFGTWFVGDIWGAHSWIQDKDYAFRFCPFNYWAAAGLSSPLGQRTGSFLISIQFLTHYKMASHHPSLETTLQKDKSVPKAV